MQQTANNIELIERFQQNAPVDVTAIAEALGLSVWEADDLPEKVSGKLLRDPENSLSGYSIVVRASDAYVRRRFTVAHEIGHFVLHRNRIGDGVTDNEIFRSDLSDGDEVEANRYAASLLMPRKLIARYIKLFGSDPYALAHVFKVSEQAMTIRLSSPFE